MYLTSDSKKRAYYRDRTTHLKKWDTKHLLDSFLYQTCSWQHASHSHSHSLALLVLVFTLFLNALLVPFSTLNILINPFLVPFGLLPFPSVLTHFTSLLHLRLLVRLLPWLLLLLMLKLILFWRSLFFLRLMLLKRSMWDREFVLFLRNWYKV